MHYLFFSGQSRESKSKLILFQLKLGGDLIYGEMDFDGFLFFNVHMMSEGLWFYPMNFGGRRSIAFDSC